MTITKIPVVWSAIIEWDSSETPSLVLAHSEERAMREAINIVYAVDVFMADDPEFLAEHPLPGDDADADELRQWLADMHEAVTVPWVTISSGHFAEDEED